MGDLSRPPCHSITPETSSSSLNFIPQWWEGFKQLLYVTASVVAERKRQVSALLDSTPHLFEAALVRRFVRELRSNVGVVQLLYQFLQLLALHYDHNWCVGGWVWSRGWSHDWCVCTYVCVQVPE